MVRHVSARKATSLVLLSVLALQFLCCEGFAQVRSETGKEASKPADGQNPLLSDQQADQYFKTIYRDFYETYRLGPEDEIAIRVVGQPDYSLEKVRVSPVGRVFHPLIGEVEVVGRTIEQLTFKLTVELSQFIKEPRVTVSLLEANSAKVGVIGEVKNPGIRVITRPTRVLDAISASGGFTDFGSTTNVSIYRSAFDGRMSEIKVNVKRMLKAGAESEDNVTLKAGDTVVVHGNKKKVIAQVTSLLGFATFLSSIALTSPAKGK